ncbi:MAG: hydrogenase maturation protease [Candidatus Omnitrophica bacterium]|nr:hydrogenase maturation protease [Candidatus Omnitrophota bacterium]
MSDNKIAVIGLGNTLRRDDGIGILVLESLRNSYRKQGIDYLNFGIASIDLLHRLQNYKKALLIDGINASLEPGEIKIFKLSEVVNILKKQITSSHEFNLKDVFVLYKKLGLKTEVFIAGIQVQDVSFASGLTEKLKKSYDNIVEKVNNFIDKELLGK